MTKPFSFEELVGAQLMARTGNLTSGMPEEAANAQFLSNLSEGIRQIRYSLVVESVPEGRKCVHTEHCCAIHGCKYGDDFCPVEQRQVRQSYPCEACSEGW